MPRLPTCLLLPLALAAAPRAQEEPVLGLVTGPERRPLVAAEVAFLPDVVAVPPSLAALRTPLPVRRAASDARGVFKIAASGPGSVLVTTASGLGGFAPWAFPGAPVELLALQPMAEVSLPDGRPFTLMPAWIDDAGNRRPLPHQHGTALRLPAGSYECWVVVGDEVHWLRLVLRPSERRQPTLATGPRQVLRAVPDGSVQPDGRPDVRLPIAPADTITLTGDACIASFTVQWPGLGLALDHQSAATLATGLQPPAHTSRRLRCRAAGGSAAATEAWLLGAEERPAGHAVADADGRLVLACPVGHEQRTEVLFWREGSAVLQCTFADLPAAGELDLPPGSTLPITCIGPDGGPAAGVALEYTPQSAPLACMLARTDSRGRTRLLATQRPGRLNLVDPRFANGSVEVGVGNAAVRVELTRGSEVTGIVQLPAGVAAEGTVVSLRDPAGRLRPAVRSVAVDRGGGFAFAGLPAEGRFVLFAQQVQGERTWSARLPRVQAGDQLRVELVDEDPQPPRDGR